MREAFNDLSMHLRIVSTIANYFGKLHYLTTKSGNRFLYKIDHKSFTHARQVPKYNNILAE